MTLLNFITHAEFVSSLTKQEATKARRAKENGVRTKGAVRVLFSPHQTEKTSRNPGERRKYGVRAKTQGVFWALHERKGTLLNMQRFALGPRGHDISISDLAGQERAKKRTHGVGSGRRLSGLGRGRDKIGALNKKADVYWEI